MTLQRAGEMYQFTITSPHELMRYLETEGSEGTELLPLLKSKLGSTLLSEVQSMPLKIMFGWITDITLESTARQDRHVKGVRRD
jgi:hypothetical protein